MFHAADRASHKGQTDTVRWSAVQLVLLVAGAVAGAVPLETGDQVNVGGLLAALCLAVSLFPALWLASRNPQRQWYRGRAAAESVKMLAWKYAVRAHPFPADADAENKLVLRLAEVLHGVRDIYWGADARLDQEITTAMRELRESSLAERREAYLRDRLGDQYRWYSGRAQHFTTLARRWSVAAAVATGIGVVGGFLHGFQVIDFDLLGAASAMAAAVTAWVQLKQLQPLAAAYSLTAHELLLVKARLEAVTDEDEWAQACSEAEEAISREHTMWLALRDF